MFYMRSAVGLYSEIHKGKPVSLAGNAWEPPNRKYCFRPPPPPTIVVSLTTSATHFLSLSLSL
jgi:hypothetical protein